VEYPSRLIEDAVNEVSKLPGIGKKTALRLVLHLLKEGATSTKNLSHSLNQMREKVKYCTICNNISDDEVCRICNGFKRDKSLLCVVEDTRDVMAIENTSQFSGIYHVLGGVISPVEGIGPDQLTIIKLLDRIAAEDSIIEEVIFALSPTMEGDTTIFYITKKIEKIKVKIKVSSIARGVPIGGELEYIDEITLGRSILSRTVYNHS